MSVPRQLGSCVIVTAVMYWWAPSAIQRWVHGDLAVKFANDAAAAKELKSSGASVSTSASSNSTHH